MSAAARVLAIVTDAWGAEGGIAQYNRDFLSALGMSDAVEHVDVMAYSAARDFPVEPARRVAMRASDGRAAFAARCLGAARGRDVVFCGHLHLAPLAAWVARRARAPLWLQVHGIEAWPRPSRIRRAASECAGLVTAVSRYTRERVCGWARIDERRVRVLPNTVDTQVFSADGDHGSGSPVILSVGRLAAGERYKGHDRVIALLPRLRAERPGVRYRIVGDGDDRARLVALAAASGVGDAVEFAGHLPRERLAQELRDAALFVMPSTGEGFGIAFVEALACGTPALGLDEDGSRDALGDGDLGSVCSQEGLFEAIVSGLSRPVDRRLLARRAADRFSRARFHAHVGALVQEVLVA